jgi:hypothetical protein
MYFQSFAWWTLGNLSELFNFSNAICERDMRTQFSCTGSIVLVWKLGHLFKLCFLEIILVNTEQRYQLFLDFFSIDGSGFLGSSLLFTMHWETTVSRTSIPGAMATCQHYTLLLQCNIWTNLHRTAVAEISCWRDCWSPFYSIHEDVG